ncbi:MAG: energy-coupling factor transporter ATPase [Clostridiales bacterium]|nr:MAG: energy-coupling factor transporter ATPase [Clostridiales bacterium]
MEQKKIIKSEKLTYQYENKNKNAVDAIDFAVAEGEFVAVLGHNGSGKSTLAKLINALLLPTDGLLYVDGMATSDEDNIWQIRRTAGMVFQNPDNQIIATIAEEDVAFGPENLGYSRAEIVERVNFAIERVGMTKFKRRPPHMLSGGQKQRISIAGVLAMHPKCIIFDEPTAMLDPLGRVEVMDTIMDLHRSGITVVLITHYMGEAAMADRIIVMDEGEIVKNGAPNDVFWQVEDMYKLSLDVPAVIKIANILKRDGIDIGNISTLEELIEGVCQYNSKM